MDTLRDDVEQLVNQKAREGYEIVTVVFWCKYVVDANSIYNNLQIIYRSVRPFYRWSYFMNSIHSK